jgi:hypothetical protein
LVVPLLCHSLIAEKGRVTTAAVEINTVTFASNTGSSSRALLRTPSNAAFIAAGNRSQIRSSVGSTVWLDVSFRVLVGSDRSAAELGIAFSNLVNGGILSDVLNRAVSAAKIGPWSIVRNELLQWTAAHFDCAYLLNIFLLRQS